MIAAQPILESPPCKPLWDTELVVLRGESRADLVRQAAALREYLAQRSDCELAELAVTLNTSLTPGGERLAVIASSVADLVKKLSRAEQRLADPKCQQIRDVTGIYYFAQPLGREGHVAFLFPGEGAQYLGMLDDVRQAFPVAQQFINLCDDALADQRGVRGRLSEVFLLPPGSSEADKQRAEEQLRRLDNAMLSVLVVDGALYHLLISLGIAPAAAAGHSMGEMAALSSADCVENDDQFVGRLGRIMQSLHDEEQSSSEAGAVLLAVGAGREALAEVLTATGNPPVHLAMDNCPHQTVVVGPPGPMDLVQAELVRRQLICERLPLHRAYHTPLFQPFLGALREMYAPVKFRAPRIPVYSCITAQPFPADGEQVRNLAIGNWAEPVRFTELIRNMHAAGARLFVEIGPRGNLSAFVEDILRGQNFAALPANVLRKSGLTQLNHLLGNLAAHDVPITFESYYAPRELETIVLPAELRVSAPVIQAVLPIAAPVSPDESNGCNYPASGRAAVMHEYLNVMEQFVDLQREMLEAVLNGPRQHAAPALYAERPQAHDPLPEPIATPARNFPLLGEVVRQIPSQELVLRRVLDLHEDQFVLHHTVGGINISKRDPAHCGLPVMPMTFTLEMSAEAASTLVPGMVVTAIRDIRLFRWLAFDEAQPPTVEITARRRPAPGPSGEILVDVEVNELPLSSDKRTTPYRAAQMVVALTPEYPAMPQKSSRGYQNARAYPMSLEVMYCCLFHGPKFQGLREVQEFGDDGISIDLEVLPRDHLFRSQAEPQFCTDPVLLDVIMHPLAVWHDHQADRSGRIMLPIGVESFEFFAPPPAPGTRLISRGWLRQADVRSFTHDGETVTPEGQVFCRMTGVKTWRFYVPFGEVNFFGPKDQYFLSQRIKTPAAARRQAIMVLDAPVDLQQPAMNRVTAKVTLTPAELASLQRDVPPGKAAGAWLFERITAKDAMRTLWHDQCGERLFPADIEATEIAPRIYSAHLSGAPDQKLAQSVVAVAGNKIVALAAEGETIGLAAEILEANADVDAILQRLVRRAAAWALGMSAGTEAQFDLQPLADELAFAVASPSGGPLRVYAACDKDLALAWTVG